MTSRDFVNWLKGYLENCYDDVEIRASYLKDKIKEIKDEDTIKYIIGIDSYKDEEKVPYHTMCSCNLANGGSGICGCTIANKMVDKYLKGVIIDNATELAEAINKTLTNK